MPFGPYFVAGWRVDSDVDLPELHTWSASDGAICPLRLELSAGCAPVPSGSFAVEASGEAVLRIPEVGTFTIAPDGTLVQIRAQTGADPVLLRGCFYGSALAVLCYQRGLLPVHGSAVLLDGKAIVISGPSGAGKSTLATAMVRRGHILLSDDLCPFDLSTAARPLLWPTLARVKLLSDAMAAFGLSAAATYTRAAQGMKGNFAMAALSSKLVRQPVPVAAVFLLGDRQSNDVSITTLNRKDAFLAVESQVHRAAMGRCLGSGPRMFEQTCKIAASLPLYRLNRPHDLGRLDEMAAQIEKFSEAL